MTPNMLNVLRTLFFLVMFLATGLGTSLGGDLKGRISLPRGSGPTIVFVQGVRSEALPKQDTVITHLVGGEFTPSVAIAYVGNQFIFKNEDDALHTTHLYLQLAYQKEVSGRPIKNGATLYNIALPKPGMEVSRPVKPYFRFSADTGVIDVRCNSHPTESATVLVFDHPFVTVADSDGAFNISGVPAGTHEVWIWQDGGASIWKSIEVSDS